MAKRDPRLRAFVKLDARGQVVPSVVLLRLHKPKGQWLEINADACCTTSTSTTTTP